MLDRIEAIKETVVQIPRPPALRRFRLIESKGRRRRLTIHLFPA